MNERAAMGALEGIATSAALYLADRPTADDAVRLQARVYRMFGAANLPINAIESSLAGEATVVATNEDLVRGLTTGELENFTLLSLRDANSSHFADWRAAAWLEVSQGIIYLGIVNVEPPMAASWLRNACQLAEGFDVRYGISYVSPLADYPDLYSMGGSVCSLPYAAKSRQERDRLDAWCAELGGSRRHLTGYYRGAYLANVISDSHLRRVDPRSHNIGSLSTLGPALWLWELEESELSVAEAVLDAAGALIK